MFLLGSRPQQKHVLLVLRDQQQHMLLGQDPYHTVKIWLAFLPMRHPAWYKSLYEKMKLFSTLYVVFASKPNQIKKLWKAMMTFLLNVCGSPTLFDCVPELNVARLENSNAAFSSLFNISSTEGAVNTNYLYLSSHYHNKCCITICWGYFIQLKKKFNILSPI